MAADAVCTHPHSALLPLPCTLIWLPTASTCHFLPMLWLLKQFSLVEVLGDWHPPGTNLPPMTEMCVLCCFPRCPQWEWPWLPTVGTGLITHPLLAASLLCLTSPLPPVLLGTNSPMNYLHRIFVSRSSWENPHYENSLSYEFRAGAKSHWIHLTPMNSCNRTHSRTNL